MSTASQAAADLRAAAAICPTDLLAGTREVRPADNGWDSAPLLNAIARHLPTVLAALDAERG